MPTGRVGARRAVPGLACGTPRPLAGGARPARLSVSAQTSGREDARRGVNRRAPQRLTVHRSTGDGCSLLLEATAAVHRPAEPRHERHRRVRSAVRAGDGRHLEAPARRPLSAPVDEARRAALGLIQQPFLEVEPLLPCGEDKRPSAISASQRLILKCHRFPSLRQVVKPAAVGRIPSSGPRMRQSVGQSQTCRQAIR